METEHIAENPGGMLIFCPPAHCPYVTGNMVRRAIAIGERACDGYMLKGGEQMFLTPAQMFTYTTLYSTHHSFIQCGPLPGARSVCQATMSSWLSPDCAPTMPSVRTLSVWSIPPPVPMPRCTGFFLDHAVRTCRSSAPYP